MGYLNLEQGESRESVENFNSVIAKNPGNYLALFYSGEAYQNLGLTAKAENVYKRIAELNEADFAKKDTIKENDFPLQTYAMFRLARIYINYNRPDSAELLLREIIDNWMTFGPAYRLLGNVYDARGDSSLSEKYNVRANDLVEYTPPADELIDRIALLSRSDTYLQAD